jgi:hypothetical protein
LSIAQTYISTSHVLLVLNPGILNPWFLKLGFHGGSLLMSILVLILRAMWMWVGFYLQYGVSSRLVHYAERVLTVKELLQAEERVCPALQSEAGDQGGRVGSVKQHSEGET